jgi:hypothetical protein
MIGENRMHIAIIEEKVPTERKIKSTVLKD